MRQRVLHRVLHFCVFTYKMNKKLMCKVNHIKTLKMMCESLWKINKFKIKESAIQVDILYSTGLSSFKKIDHCENGTPTGSFVMNFVSLFFFLNDILRQGHILHITLSSVFGTSSHIPLNSVYMRLGFRTVAQ